MLYIGILVQVRQCVTYLALYVCKRKELYNICRYIIMETLKRLCELWVMANRLHVGFKDPIAQSHIFTWLGKTIQKTKVILIKYLLGRHIEYAHAIFVL